MANKFGLGSLPLESKNPMSSTAFVNKAKPFFVDQIGDTLQGDIDMNKFKITNLKFPGNDNDAVNKKYLLDQINAIQIDKDHVENRINDVKRFIRRNIKNLVDEPKLQQELTSLKRLIQVDKTSGKYTSIDVHKSQQEREFIVHLSFAEGSDSILEGGGFISRAKINIEKEKIKYSYHLKEDHTKKEMSLVRVNVFTFNTRKYNNARPNKEALYDIPWFHLSEIHLI
ncbi:hypothetical protein LOTGIDRAFT_157595 [Lottia gigantea]|uniref:Uncharacterized protein n=1 Tax=Lottia gigantea TaxID=225164 RepID=V4ABR6_LOTGI|nr:hypothetical protein LOTGIDRAFT_157595 [Lottia gigantea]ESP01414.1 hypothetical protein LOTGIDRAFT_157595 [Lottia gigantea]